jgi:hypothetical protein
MIENEGVSISSVSVTIKALKVNNRQMTQAVFTQLPKIEPINIYDDRHEFLDSYTLAGNLWGWVNWTPKGSDPEERQFVVEVAGRLCRGASQIDKVLPSDRDTWDKTTREEHLRFMDRAVDLTRILVAQGKIVRDRAALFRHGVDSIILGSVAPFGNLVGEYCRGQFCVYGGDTRALLGGVDGDDVRSILTRPDFPTAAFDRAKEASEEVARQALSDAGQRIGTHITKMNAMREVLAKVEQLFIAV